MKTSKLKVLISGAVMAASIVFASDASAQTRKLPDGTIIYSDGTRRLPNGTVIYKDRGPVDDRNSTVTLPDGTVVLPDGSGRYPDDRTYRKDRRHGNRNGKGLPPGQAKKIYGGSAKDYAPGQQKKWNNNKGWKKKNRS